MLRSIRLRPPSTSQLIRTKCVRIKGAAWVYLVHKLLIKPITRPHSLWNLKNYLSMATLQLHVKQICLPNKKSNITNNKNEPLKTGVAHKFSKYPNCKTLRSSLSSMPPFVFFCVLFSSFNALSGCFYVSLSLVAVPNLSSSINFVTHLL